MNITATAKRWERGWEFSIDGEVVTQVSALSKAEQQIRDYLDTVTPEVDHSDWTVTIEPDLRELGQRVHAAKVATLNAAEAQEDAAREASAVARQLRAAGVSAVDSAVILGLSTARVSQLVNR